MGHVNAKRRVPGRVTYESAADPAEAKAGPRGGTVLLSVRGLQVVYGDVVMALRDVNLDVPAGGIVALLGANGSGKTTLLRAVTGLLKPHRGVVCDGTVTLDDTDITHVSAAAIVRRGIAQVMEGRRIFAELSVDENLRAGAYTRRSRRETAESYDQVMSLFPALRDRRRSTAGYLSGGQQQMLAIGRALMASPRLLLLDEPSLGLAPRLVEQVRDAVVRIREQGTSVLLIEQNAAMALAIANVGYVLETGTVVRQGVADDLMSSSDIRDLYLGGADRRRRPPPNDSRGNGTRGENP